jgi:hypothetical protein
MPEWAVIAAPFVVLPVVALVVFSGCGIDQAGRGESEPDPEPGGVITYPDAGESYGVRLSTMRLRCSTPDQRGVQVRFEWRFTLPDGRTYPPEHLPPESSDAVAIDERTLEHVVSTWWGDTQTWTVRCYAQAPFGTVDDETGVLVVDAPGDHTMAFTARGSALRWTVEYDGGM